MQAPFEMTNGLDKLRSIITSFPIDSPHWNEAQNRFQFIDRLLCECLGWQKPDMRVEVKDEAGGKSDYILANKAVLEAKREARLWETLPTGQASTVRKLRPLVTTSKSFEDAVLQVIPYCTMQGAPIAVVCNGPQLAIFQAIIIGQSPLEGECFFFNGFQQYLDNFPLLWTLLSPEGIAENRAFRDLGRHRTPRIPLKASTNIPEPHSYRYRDTVQEELRQLGALLLEEIEDNPELKQQFFSDCYVPLEANNRHLLLSKKIINARYKRVSDDGIAPSALGSAMPGGQLGIQLTANAGSRPIVVVGDVGVGKTSFFENLALSIASNSRSEAYIVHINLGIKANLTADLRTYILDAIPADLLKHHGLDIFAASFVEAVYKNELEQFDRGIEGRLKAIDARQYEEARITFLKKKVDRADSHLLASLSHLSRTRRKKLVLVLDNSDQRKFEFQQEAFLIAQELAASRSLLVFVALRPSTFYASKLTGALSGYQNKLLTIAPPPADEVLERRITFALRLAEGQVAPANLEGIRLNLHRIAHFLRATLRSISTNEEIRQFLGNITGGNTRLVIELITSFCGSPNVDAKKIVEIEAEYGNYKVPLHEFTKHALLGEYSYYNPHSSLVACNVFDVSTADPREHFLRSLIIAYLSSNLGIRDNDGFLTGENISREMLRLGFLDDQVSSALVRLSEKRLIETPHSHYRELEVPDSVSPMSFHYRATSIGIYHTRYWSGSFSFLDATSIDTPIFDEDARAKIAELAASFTIRQRYDKTVAFRDYLETRWHAADIQSPYYDFPTLIESQQKGFVLVERALPGDAGRGVKKAKRRSEFKSRSRR